MATKAKTGRPPRVTQQAIVDAALKIGLEQANVRTVAAAIGMSLPGLHYYVSTRDQLLDMVFETIFGQLVSEISEQEGNFKCLLSRYAQGFFNLLSQSPTTISMIYSGRTVVSSMSVSLLERIIRSGVESGLRPEQAYEIFRQVSSAAVGAAAFEAADSVIKDPEDSIWKQFEIHIPKGEEIFYIQSIAPTSGTTEEFDNFSAVLVMLDGLMERAGIS